MDSLALPGPFQASVWVATSPRLGMCILGAQGTSPQDPRPTTGVGGRHTRPPPDRRSPRGGPGSPGEGMGQLQEGVVRAACGDKGGEGEARSSLERMLKTAAWQALGGCSQCAGAEGHALSPPLLQSPLLSPPLLRPLPLPTSLSQQPSVPMTLGAGFVGQRMLTAL